MRSMTDRVVGISITVSTIMGALNLASDTITEHPNWWGVFSAVCAVFVGCLACASVIRDRLS